MAALELDSVTKRFGALAGPNGAGKTTLFNLISGELPLDEGTIKLDGRDVTRYSPERMVSAGLGRTFQRNSLFLESAVFENVRLAVQRRMGIRFQMLRPVTAYSRLREETEKILELVRLADRAQSPADALSYGEQRQLELGISLATSPKILLLDEPTAGMSTKETSEMVAMLKELSDEITLIIVEHDMDVVTALARRIIVLNFGRLIADGPPAEVRRDEEVLAAYLGTGLEEVPDA